MAVPIGIQESLRKIFTPIIVGDIERNNPILPEKSKIYRVCMAKFLATFPSNIFEDEYAFIYEVITTLKIKHFTRNQLRTIIENNADLILESPYINISKWVNMVDNRPLTDDEKIEAFTMNVMDLFHQLSNDLVTEEEFNAACELYISYYVNEHMLRTAQNMSLIMSDTGFQERKPKGRTVFYKGVEDAQKYYNEKIKIIRELSAEDKIKALKIDANWLEQELKKEELEDDESILDFGIQEIDSVIKSLRRSHMLGILGPPKGGKTRMTNYLVNRALSRGLNVAVWPLEGTPEEWIACQIAAIVRTTWGHRLDSKRILERKYESDDIKQLVIAAKTMLATDYRRGKLSFIQGTAYVEDFIDVLQTHYDTENPFDIIVIDQLINIQSRTRKGKVERISEAYALLKDYIANKMQRRALAIIPCQLKQDVVDYLRAHPNETIDVTAGGESAETIRSPDEVIGLFSSKEERKGNMMKIYHVASRHSENFDDFYARCELECCNFYSDPNLNV